MAGREYTDAVVEPASAAQAVPVEPAVPVVPVVPVAPVERVKRVAPKPHAEPVRSGRIVVVSRPPGATVIVNGRRIGATPVTTPAIQAGTHVVSIQRPGYRPWVTRVQLAEGARARVAASLVGGQAKE
jgi:hypothetical protein